MTLSPVDRDAQGLRVLAYAIDAAVFGIWDACIYLGYSAFLSHFVLDAPQALALHPRTAHWSLATTLVVLPLLALPVLGIAGLWLRLWSQGTTPGKRIMGVASYHDGAPAALYRMAARQITRAVLHGTVIGFVVDAVLLGLTARTLPDRLYGTDTGRVYRHSQGSSA